MWRWVKKLWELLGHAETVQALLHTQIFKAIVMPALVAGAAGTTGILGNIPVMWIIMATAVAFAATITGILQTANYHDRRNPAYKLQVMRTLFNFELVEISPPNRQKRRAAGDSAGPAVPAHRQFAKGQLGVEIWNRSSIPISLIVENADTRIQDMTPPRVKYPKEPVIIQPGTTVWIHDEAIDLKKMYCENLDGSIDITLKYGLPGKERFEINQKGTVEIFMEPYGFYKGMYFHPASSSAAPVTPRSSH